MDMKLTRREPTRKARKVYVDVEAKARANWIRMWDAADPDGLTKKLFAVVRAGEELSKQAYPSSEYNPAFGRAYDTFGVALAALRAHPRGKEILGEV